MAAAAFAADTTSLAVRKENVRAFLDRGDFAKAAEQAKVMNRETPDDISTYQLLAAADLGLGDYDKAEHSIQWMLDLRIGKADAAGWLLVAQLREVTGDLDGAIEAVNLAYSRVVPGQRPDTQSLLVYSAKLQMLLGKLDYAEKILQGMNASLPGGEAALAALAQLRILQHREADANEILRRLAYPGSHPRYFYQQAMVSAKPEDYQVFEAAALQRKDDFDNANIELILYYAGQGKRPDRALNMARSEVTKRHDVLTLDALAMALFESGETTEARTTMERILAVGTRNPEVLRHAARLGVNAK